MLPNGESSQDNSKSQRSDDTSSSAEKSPSRKRTKRSFLHSHMSSTYRYLRANKDNSILGFPNNNVSTGKYTAKNFIFKNMYEQFSRMANVYFLIISILTAMPISPKDPFSLIGTFIFVLTVTACKEIYEDVQRHKSDEEANTQEATVVTRGKRVTKHWRDILCGDIVVVKKDEPIPADLILVSTNDLEHGTCFIDTCNIDGETNLKTMNALECTKKITSDEEIGELVFDVECENPNPSLYTFTGSVSTNYSNTKVSVGVSNVLLRGCFLRQTRQLYGVVIFTGHDTKLYKNSSSPPFKVSYLMKMMNRCLVLVFAFQAVICATNTFFAKRFSDSTIGKNMAYCTNDLFLNQPNDEGNFKFHKALELGINFEVETWLTFVVAYSNLIPISLYVALEMVKLFQVVLINNDLHMYHEATNTPPLARTSNLVEELGQVKFIFSDKTGTLTCNIMEFACCSIFGKKFHTQSTFTSDDSTFLDEAEYGKISGDSTRRDEYTAQKLFWQLLSVCHTVLAEYPDDSPGDLSKVKYQASSPDEAALVAAAGRVGHAFLKGTPAQYQILNKQDGATESWEILVVIEFNSTRKRMSVIARAPDKKVYLFCKGADNVIISRLQKDRKNLSPVHETTEHLTEFSEIGLRTLCLAYKELSEEECSKFVEEWHKASLSISHRDDIQSSLAETIERELILVGATAIEDKLQDGVPEAIDTLAHEAGIKFWVLTGDKQETAINIGFSCKLLTQDMNIHILSGAKTVSDLTQHIITTMMNDIGIGESDSKHAIVIDGATLTLALNDEVKMEFLEFALLCDVCICCRVSPKQKAEVVKLVRDNLTSPPVITLAIGDGANDVSMIQAAHIGIGISGQEGMQAVRASDFSIAQFRFLVRLLLVHGGWAYKRISKFIVYYFYKNMANVLTEYFFAFETAFSGQILFADWLSIGYNAAYSSFGCIFGFCLDQDVNSETIMSNPRLYEYSMYGMGFDMVRFAKWMILALWHAAVCYYMPMCMMDGIKGSDGLVMGHWFHGTTSFVCLILIIHLKLGVMVYSWNYMVKIAILVEVMLFFVTFLILCTYWMSTGLSWQPRMLGMATLLFSNPKFYLCVLLTSTTGIIPDIIEKYISSNYRPLPHNILHEVEMGHRCEEVEVTDGINKNEGNGGNSSKAAHVRPQ